MTDADQPIDPSSSEASSDSERLVRQETRQGNTEARQGTAEARMGKGDERAQDAEGRLDAIEALAAANARATEEVQGLRKDIAALLEENQQRNRQARTYKIVAAALLLVAVVGFGMDRQNVARFEREARARTAESVSTDRAFCLTTNDNRTAINTNRNALRATQGASRRAYLIALAPQEDDDEETRQQRAALLNDLLGTLNSAPIDADLPLLDCAGVGNGRIDFSIQDAIIGSTTLKGTP